MQECERVLLESYMFSTSHHPPQISFKVLEYAFSGCRIDPRSVTLFPNTKCKTSISKMSQHSITTHTLHRTPLLYTCSLLVFTQSICLSFDVDPDTSACAYLPLTLHRNTQVCRLWLLEVVQLYLFTYRL